MVPGLKTSVSRVDRGPWPLFNGLTKATLTLLGPPPGTFRLLVQVLASKGHTTCTGRVTINSTENLDFTLTGQKEISTSFLTSKPSITTSGLDCSLLITCVDKNGATIEGETLTEIKCRWDESSKRIQTDQNTWKLSTSEILTADSDCAVGSIIRKSDHDYEVIMVKVFSKLSGREFLRRAWLAG